MAKLRHIAIATKDPKKTAEFYKKHFEMKDAGIIENDLAEGCYLTDGVVNLAILKFRSANTSLPWDSADFTGIHHFGFIVDDLKEAMRRLEEDGSTMVASYYQGRGEETVYYERKYVAPDNVVIDISERGWVGAKRDV